MQTYKPLIRTIARRITGMDFCRLQDEVRERVLVKGMDAAAEAIDDDSVERETQVLAHITAAVRQELEAIGLIGSGTLDFDNSAPAAAPPTHIDQRLAEVDFGGGDAIEKASANAGDPDADPAIGPDLSQVPVSDWLPEDPLLAQTLMNAGIATADRLDAIVAELDEAQALEALKELDGVGKGRARQLLDAVIAARLSLSGTPSNVVDPDHGTGDPDADPETEPSTQEQ